MLRYAINRDVFVAKVSKKKKKELMENKMLNKQKVYKGNTSS